MWSSLTSSSVSRAVGLRGPKGTNFINPSSTNKVKKVGDCLGIREPLLCKEDDGNKNLEKGTSVEGNNNKGVVRVKVKMTKEEAARLMSKCKGNGILEFRDVAHELVQIPVDRVTVVSSTSIGYGGMLNTIPEEVY